MVMMNLVAFPVFLAALLSKDGRFGASLGRRAGSLVMVGFPEFLAAFPGADGGLGATLNSG